MTWVLQSGRSFCWKNSKKTQKTYKNYSFFNTKVFQGKFILLLWMFYGVSKAFFIQISIKFQREWLNQVQVLWLIKVHQVQEVLRELQDQQWGIYAKRLKELLIFPLSHFLSPPIFPSLLPLPPPVGSPSYNTFYTVFPISPFSLPTHLSSHLFASISHFFPLLPISLPFITLVMAHHSKSLCLSWCYFYPGQGRDWNNHSSHQ